MTTEACHSAVLEQLSAPRPRGQINLPLRDEVFASIGLANRKRNKFREARRSGSQLSLVYHPVVRANECSPQAAVLSAMPSNLPSVATCLSTWGRMRGAHHDLMHALATDLVAQGFVLLLIGKAPNHSQSSTAARYANLDFDPVHHELEHNIGDGLSHC